MASVRTGLGLLGSLCLAQTDNTREVTVTSAAEIKLAISQAQAGDKIIAAPGTYDMGTKVSCTAQGSRAQPIVVTAANPGSVTLRWNGQGSYVEGFLVQGKYWTFENLVLEGVCADHNYCEVCGGFATSLLVLPVFCLNLLE